MATEQFLRFTKIPPIFILLLGMLVMVGIGVAHTFPPATSSLTKSNSVFSANRVMQHVQRIGVKPHPAGTQANIAVRQYLITQLEIMGLHPEVQSAQYQQNKGFINNVLVKVPGAKPGKALVLMAHYDSVPTGPGAADDGASVGAILETLKVLKSQTDLQNDLFCLFTDGEELGLLGAKAFIDQHPLAKKIGMVLNFEYRGNSGAFMMFETSDGNGKLIDGLAKAVPFILSSSLMYEVYKRLPNDTDFTVFKLAGIPGMNFAAIEGHQSYHSPLDRPDQLNQDSLQHEGDIMLALVNYFGNQNIEDLSAENHIYFDFPGLGLCHYPIAWSIPLSGLVVLMFIALFMVNCKKRSIRILPVLFSLFFYLILISLLYFGNGYIWSGLRLWHPDYQNFAHYDTSQSYNYLAVFILLNVAIFAGFYLLAKKWFRPLEISFGITTVWLILTLLTVNNGINFLFTWPLLSVLLTFSLVSLPCINRYSVYMIAILLVGSSPGLLLFTPLIKNLFVGLTASNMSIILLFLSLIFGLLISVLTLLNPSNSKVNIISTV